MWIELREVFEPLGIFFSLNKTTRAYSKQNTVKFKGTYGCLVDGQFEYCGVVCWRWQSSACVFTAIWGSPLFAKAMHRERVNWKRRKKTIQMLRKNLTLKKIRPCKCRSQIWRSRNRSKKKDRSETRAIQMTHAISIKKRCDEKYGCGRWCLANSPLTQTPLSCNNM